MGKLSGGSLSRRAFMSGSLGAAAGLVLWTPDLWNPARAKALRSVLATTANPAGTTLESTIVLSAGAGPGAGYLALKEGPGWPTIARTELASLQAARADARTALASIVQLTDVHIVDAQSPGRVEFLDRYGDP